MTREEFERLLEGRELQEAMDVRTLVLDLVKDMSYEEMMDFFWERLPALSAETLQDYFYMKRV